MKKTIFTIVALLILFILLWQGCNFYTRYNNLLTQVSKFKDSELAFNVQRQKDSSTLASQEAMLLSQEEAIRLGLLKLTDNFTTIQSQVSAKTKIIIDKQEVPFLPPHFADTTGWAAKFKNGDTSKATIDSVLANSIQVPAKFDKKDKWFTINGVVNKNGLLFDTISIPNETAVTIGWKKTGFLNLGRKQVVDLKNSNPYLNVESMKNVVIKPNKSLLNNKLVWFGVGVAGGIYLSTKL